MQKHASEYFFTPSPRRDVVRLIEKELQSRVFIKQIWLSFIGDVYCQSTDDNMATLQVLQLLNRHNAPVAVISKNPQKMLRDLDVLQAFGDRIMAGTTLTFLDEKSSVEWEPGANLPAARLDALQTLHNNGIKTHASFEPVIDPEESLKLIAKTLELNCVDHYKIGKLNNYKGLDKGINWESFLQRALAILRPAGKQVYIKHGLRVLCPHTPLTPEETNPEQYIVRSISTLTAKTDSNVVQESLFEER
jgi:hypothetical protein